MAAPVRVRIPWKIIARMEGSAAAHTDPVAMAAEARRRERLSKLPIAQFVTGRPDRRALAEDSVAELPDGVSLPVRIYRPRDAGGERLAVVVNFHGGGWVSGSARQSEWWCTSLAAQARVAIVSVDYRLAPVHRFPVAVEDCYAATVWVAENAERLGVDAGRLAVMGDSAGGNLAAVVSILARDRGGPAITLQVLIYPAVDMVEQYPSEIENANAPVLTKSDMDRHRDLYLGGADRADPLASPLRAPLRGLPPAFILTAQYDPLRDQGDAYAAALRDAGGQARVVNYPRAVHGYISIPGLDPQARVALADTVREMRRVLRAVAGAQ